MSSTVSEEQLVLIVNELHHNFEKNYHETNRAMHLSERTRWLQLLSSITVEGKDILDIGTGSGFIPSVFLHARVRFHSFTCSDISAELLADARLRLGKDSKQFLFVKLRNQKLPFADGSMDVIIVNSVLHHLPNRKKFYSETVRVLRPGGLLIVAHEPNKRFMQSKFLHGISKFAAASFAHLGKIRQFLCR